MATLRRETMWKFGLGGAIAAALAIGGLAFFSEPSAAGPTVAVYKSPT